MKEYTIQLKEFFDKAAFDWCVCSGYAIDLFVGHGTRSHDNLDVAVFWQDKKKIINYMLDRKWGVFEVLGNGVVCELINGSTFSPEKHHLICFTKGNDNCHLASLGSDMYQLSLDSREHARLDYIEFLFSYKEDDFFLYAYNPAIYRPLQQAVLNKDGTAYLAPEMVLLYKSVYINYMNKEDEASLRLVSNAVNDFNLLLPLLGNERKEWLSKALKAAYPNGHAWLRRLKSSAS
jgi:hypothetical protein